MLTWTDSLPGTYSVGGVENGREAGAVNGTWGTAQEVPGTAALNQGGNAQVGSVSCTSPGNCSAGGQYLDGAGHYQAFVVHES